MARDSAVIHLRPGRLSPPAPDVLLTYEEAAGRLKVSARTVRRWVQRGTIPHVRLEDSPSLVRIPVDALDAWWRARAVGGR